MCVVDGLSDESLGKLIANLLENYSSIDEDLNGVIEVVVVTFVRCIMRKRKPAPEEKKTYLDLIGGPEDDEWDLHEQFFQISAALMFEESDD